VRLESRRLAGADILLVHHLPNQPKGKPVLVLHGIESHPLWFVGSADCLAAAGHDVYQLQRRGSGAAAEDRGHADSPAQLLADLDAAATYILTQTRADALHLLAISWGGKLAAAYALDAAHAAKLADLTLVAPGLAPRVDLTWQAKLRIALCALVAPRRGFPVPLEDPALFTDTPDRQAYIREDPYRLQTVTARFLLTSWLLDRRLAGAAAGALNLPVRLILADRDRIIDNARTQAALARLAGENLHVHELCSAHTLEFEPDPQPFLELLVDALG
jgi:alpha-beta hydrolase superfamily lysophospholipase